MITLYQFPSIWGLPNASPFCLKLETYLRMAKIPFEIRELRDPRKSPKGKLPFIKDNDKVISDSDIIIHYLKKNYHDLDTHLTKLQKAESLAIQRMLEDHFYFVLLYSRWIDANYWPITKEAFFRRLNPVFTYLLPIILRTIVSRELYAQGTGRHTRDEIYRMGVIDLKGLSEILNGQLFMMGDVPSSIDACVYAFLANTLYTPIKSSVEIYASTQKNFLEYCERMKSKFF